MRLGVIADVHANLPALEVALERLAGERVDELVCLGDVVGYGPQPNECVERLAAAGVLTVQGNHDLIALGRLPLDGVGPLARRTLEWTSRALAPAAREWLGDLPPQTRLADALATHAALDPPWEYVATAEAAARQLALLARLDGAPRLLLVGHTHRAMLAAEDGARLDLTGTEPLAPRALLNPGSVGQSRERLALARFASVDGGSGAARATFYAEPYDIRGTRRALRRLGLPADAAHPTRPPSRGRHLVRRLARRAG